MLDDKLTERVLAVQSTLQITMSAEVERLEVPLIGRTRVAYRQGAVVLTLLLSSDWIAPPVHLFRFTSASRNRTVIPVVCQTTTNGRWEAEFRVASEDVAAVAIDSVVSCLERDGDLRRLVLPNPRPGVLLLEFVRKVAPWRGYRRGE